MIGKSNCLTCNKEFKWRYRNAVQKYCSRKCLGKHVHTWNYRNRFLWKTATKEQQIEHLRSIFNKNVIKKDGCWDWQGRCHNGGYAVMVHGSDHKQIGAHRVSWMIHKGEIPKGLFVLHKCDNKPCTNPEHLFLGTIKDNVQDMHKKGRANRLKNEEHPNAKLTIEKVKKIKELLSIGVTMTRISKDFHISHGAISAIKNGITWNSID